MYLSSQSQGIEMSLFLTVGPSAGTWAIFSMQHWAIIFARKESNLSISKLARP
jgi:hypothetical protein